MSMHLTVSTLCQLWVSSTCTFQYITVSMHQVVWWKFYYLLMWCMGLFSWELLIRVWWRNLYLVSRAAVAVNGCSYHHHHNHHHSALWRGSSGPSMLDIWRKQRLLRLWLWRKDTSTWDGIFWSLLLYIFLCLHYIYGWSSFIFALNWYVQSFQFLSFHAPIGRVPQWFLSCACHA